MIVGWKLIKIRTRKVVQEWGGSYGSCPEIPNPLLLPNGDHQWCPQVGTNYNGFRLEAWEVGPGVQQIKDECQRRIVVATGASDLMGCLIKQMNSPRGTKGSEEMWAEIDRLRKRSNELEKLKKIPDDYTSDKHWEADE